LPPAIVLVDASDFPSIEPTDLAAAMGKAGEAVRAIWGADLPYGQGVLAAAQRLGIPTTPLDRREGIAPLMDLVRSRRSRR
jgi:hypothetical protein